MTDPELPRSPLRIGGATLIESPFVEPGTILVVGTGGEGPTPEDWSTMTNLERATWAIAHGAQLVVRTGFLQAVYAQQLIAALEAVAAKKKEYPR